MMSRLLLLFTLLTTLPGGALARGAADVLAGMHGQWQGRGVVREKPSAPKEAVVCSFQGRWERIRNTLHVRYLCFGADSRFETSGTLRVRGRKVFSDLLMHDRGHVSGSGRVASGKVLLSFAGKDDKGRRLRAQLTLSRSGGNRLRSVLRATDPDSGKMFTAFTLSLKRK
ncbi:MAG TPA: hypothetical protein ENK15_05815 [Thermopetrobacter sp.]|nr:hypothetical protein [Thermopetrobacter sp.]